MLVFGGSDSDHHFTQSWNMLEPWIFGEVVFLLKVRWFNPLSFLFYGMFRYPVVSFQGGDGEKTKLLDELYAWPMIEINTYKHQSCSKLTWQWKMYLVKGYLLLRMGQFKAAMFSSPEEMYYIPVMTCHFDGSSPSKIWGHIWVLDNIHFVMQPLWICRFWRPLITHRI